MPNPNARLPKYRKHKASGQAIVTLNGVDFYLGPYGSAASRPSTTDSLRSGLQLGGVSQVRRNWAAPTIVEMLARYWPFGSRSIELVDTDDYFLEMQVNRKPNASCHKCTYSVRPGRSAGPWLGATTNASRPRGDQAPAQQLGHFTVLGGFRRVDGAQPKVPIVAD